ASSGGTASSRLDAAAGSGVYGARRFSPRVGDDFEPPGWASVKAHDGNDGEHDYHGGDGTALDGVTAAGEPHRPLSAAVDEHRKVVDAADGQSEDDPQHEVPSEMYAERQPERAAA